MDSSTRKIVDEHRYDRRLKKYSSRHFPNANVVFQRIASNSDVELTENDVHGRIQYFQKKFPLANDDITNLEESMGKFEISVRKVIQCLDAGINTFKYSADELQELIDRVIELQNQVEEIGTRYLMQD